MTLFSSDVSSDTTTPYDSNKAYGFIINFTGKRLVEFSRSFGFSIRPVKDAPQ